MSGQMLRSYASADSGGVARPEKCFHTTFCRRMRNLKPSTIRISFKTFKLFVGGPSLGRSCCGYWIFFMRSKIYPLFVM